MADDCTPLLSDSLEAPSCSETLLADGSSAFCCRRTFQCRQLARLPNQSLIWSAAHTDGTGKMEVLMRSLKRTTR